MDFVTILVTSVKDFRKEAEEFYKACERLVSFNPNDELVVAYVDSEIACIVRLCFEEDVFVLRTMQVHPDFQRRGLGSIVLERFEDLLQERKIKEVYCMPYTYLEAFYGQIGFRKIENESAPKFLQDRVNGFTDRNPGKSAILMKR
jgi:N-acetylglutamate synthase-like GNAT family acetyltransferase